MQTVHAIYENGVFRPVQPIELPELVEVEFEPRVVGSVARSADDSPSAESLRQIYAVLSERYNSGYTDTAARHNEHQP